MRKRSLELREEAWLEWQDAAWHYDLERQGLGIQFDKAVEAALEHLTKVAAHYKSARMDFGMRQ